MRYASIGRALIVGALFGAALYFVPFLFFPLRFILGIVFFVFLIRLAVWGFGPPWRRGWGGPGGGWGRGADYMDRIRSMNDEEYQAFRSRFKSRCGWHETSTPPTPAQTA